MATGSNRLGTTVQTTGIAAALPAASPDPAYSFYQPQGGYGSVGNDQVARQQAEAAARRAASAARDAQRSARPSQGRISITDERALRDVQNQWIAAGMPQSGQLYSSLMAVSRQRNDAIKAGKPDPITGNPNMKNVFQTPATQMQQRQPAEETAPSFSGGRQNSYITPTHQPDYGYQGDYEVQFQNNNPGTSGLAEPPGGPSPQSTPGYNSGDLMSVYNNVYAPGTGYGMGMDPYQGFSQPTNYNSMGNKGGLPGYGQAPMPQSSLGQASSPLSGKGGYQSQPQSSGQMGGKGGQTGQMGGKGGQTAAQPPAATPAAPVQRGGYTGYGG